MGPSLYLTRPLPMPATAKTLIGVPTYNESGNLPQLVDALHAVCSEADILVVDDNSKDGTGAWVDEAASRDPRLRGMHRPRKLGAGSAILAAMRDAIAREYDYLIVIDADFTHDPNDVPQLLAGMKHADVVIGSFHAAGAETGNSPRWRYLLSRCANLYARLCFGLAASDCSNAFRCYRVGFLAQLDLSTIRSHGFSFQQEILWRLALAGARVSEMPVIFTDRAAGRSKLSWRELWEGFRVIGALGVRYRLGMRV
jgi:dolichol-phosphate mannosyltransferase